MRLVRVPLDSPLRPLEVLRAVRDDERPFALIGRWAGGGAVIGSQPRRVASPDSDPFALLDDLPRLEGRDGVGGGWFGYLGYALGGAVERLPPAPPRPSPLPPFDLAFYDHVLRLDTSGQWWFEALVEDHPRLDQLRARMAEPPPAARPHDLGDCEPRPGRRGHAEAVRWCRRYIEAGD